MQNHLPPHLQKAKDPSKSYTSATIESDEIPNNENIINIEEEELQLEKHIRVKSRN